MHHRKTIPRILSVAALALLFGSGAVLAEDVRARQSGASEGAQISAAAGQAGRDGQATLAKRDQDIMRDLAQANLAEIETGKIALERSQNPEIRQFAQRMIDDHTRSQQQLKQLADAKGVQLPTEPARKHQRVASRLSGLEGEQFDSTYRREVAEKAHKETHKVLSRAQKNAQDSDLRALAGQTLPVVSQHLDLAENLEEQRGQTSGDPASGQSGATTGAESVSGTSGEPQMRGSGKQQ